MTPPATARPRLVLDAMLLNHFARAERLDVLGDLLIDSECVTTTVVRGELRDGEAAHPVLSSVAGVEWLRVEPLDTVEALMCFARWLERIGSSTRDQGEASVFAVAELSGAIAVTDDREAVRVARAHGLRVHGTVWLLGSACRAGKLTEVAAGSLVDLLRGTGMRLPCTGAEFGVWARRHGLL